MKGKALLLPSRKWQQGEVLIFQSSLGEGIPIGHTRAGLARMVPGCILVLLFLWDLHTDARAGVLTSPRGWEASGTGTAWMEPLRNWLQQLAAPPCPWNGNQPLSGNGGASPTYKDFRKGG